MGEMERKLIFLVRDGEDEKALTQRAQRAERRGRRGWSADGVEKGKRDFSRRGLGSE
jgi:hypothetical protein